MEYEQPIRHKQIKPCKNCGEVCGFYRISNMEVYEHMYPHNGNDCEDEVISASSGKRRYCSECSAILTSELETISNE